MIDRLAQGLHRLTQQTEVGDLLWTWLPGGVVYTSRYRAWTLVLRTGLAHPGRMAPHVLYVRRTNVRWAWPAASSQLERLREAVLHQCGDALSAGPPPGLLDALLDSLETP